MDITAINSAMDAAYQAALLNPQVVPTATVGGNENVTIRTDVYRSPKGNGFRVVGRVKVGNYTAERVLNHGPETGSAKDWPSEGIEAAAQKFISGCIQAAKRRIEREFDWIEMDTMQDKLMTVREAGTLAAHPKLIAVYEWLQTVKGMAVQGQTNFPPAPHAFEEVIAEQ